MKHDKTLVLRIASEIRRELESLAALKVEFSAAPRSDLSSYGLRARASIQHDFYTGVERIFIRIAEELNGGVPRSEQWHRQLLTDMTLDLEGVRPAVISTDLAEELTTFLRFRHLFRNLYGYIHDSERIAEIEARFDETYTEFCRQLEEFLTWMTAG